MIVGMIDDERKEYRGTVRLDEIKRDGGSQQPRLSAARWLTMEVRPRIE